MLFGTSESWKKLFEIKKNYFLSQISSIVSLELIDQLEKLNQGNTNLVLMIR
jgi:hypothetical protein